jgi:curved DNA-binding protein CbpA
MNNGNHTCDPHSDPHSDPNSGPYSDLGVSRDATSDDIRRAYRKRASATHPDHGGDADDFHRVHQAYLLLSNPEARAEYDRTGNVNYQESTSREYRLERAAISTLGSLLISFVSSNVSNIVLAIREELHNLINGRQLHLSKIQKEMSRYRNVQGQLTYKGHGINIFESVIRQRLRDGDNITRQAQFDIDTYYKALEILDDYEYIEEEDDTDEVGSILRRFSIRSSSTTTYNNGSTTSY